MEVIRIEVCILADKDFIIILDIKYEESHTAAPVQFSP